MGLVPSGIEGGIFVYWCVRELFSKLNQRVRIRSSELDLAAFFYISLGVGIGLAVALSGIAVSIFAESNASITKTTDTDFSQGQLSNTAVAGVGSLGNLSIQNLTPAGWLNSAWAYRREITLNNSAASQSLTNFPVYLAFSSSNFTFANAKSDAGDLRFTSSDGVTQLSYEIQFWDQGTQIGRVWVKVPTITADNNTKIYVYYGNLAATTTENNAGVWDGYVFSSHLEDAPSNPAPQVIDLTANANNGSARVNLTDADLITGKLGQAYNFDGTRDDGFDVANSASLAINSSVSFSFWLRVPSQYSLGIVLQRGILTANTNYSVAFDEDTGTIYFGYNTGTGADHIYAVNGAFVGDVWRHITINYIFGSPGSAQVYSNGVLVGGGSWVSNTGAAAYTVDAGEGLRIAGDAVSGFNGDLDELRISNTIRSSSWALAEYTNQNGTSFTSFAGEESIPDTTAQWESAADSNVIDLIWNGGWGTGVGGSTAFAASVANVSANATINFQIRVAANLGDLTAASYVSLGIANSGTSFTVPASTFGSLGVGTGNNRYVQVRATFTSADNASNPRLDDFTISYLADDTPPETPPSGLVMQKVNGGTVMLSNDWTNDLAPYYEWVAAADSQSGVKGYCLYLGTNASADPATEKGLLGTSPVFTAGTTCGFIIASNSIDFANVNYRGGTWLSSSASPYYFKLKAVDQNGNIDTNALQFQFRFDNTLPTNPSFISLPGDFISVKDATMTWPTSGAGFATDAHSGVLGLQYRIGLGGNWYGDVHNGNQDISDLLVNDGAYTTNATYDYPVLQEGVNVIYVRTWDVAGNVTTTYLTGALKINTVAPSAPQNLAVDPATPSNTNLYSFSWQAPGSFSGQASNITYCYTVNLLPSQQNCSFTAAGALLLSADAYATQPGDNTLFLSAKDEAGNINYAVYAQVTFNYSGSAPGFPINLEVSDISIKESATWRLIVSWEAPTNVGAGIQSYRLYRSTTNSACSQDFGVFTQVGSTAGTSFADNNLTQQNYYYCVKACDSANNCSAASATISGFPDGRYETPPTLLSGPDIVSLTNTKATIEWTTDRAADTRLSYGSSSENYFPEEPSRSGLSTTHSINLVNLVPGTTYFFKARWVDEDGNVGVSTEKVFATLPAPSVRGVTVNGVGVDRAALRYTVQNSSGVRIYYGPSANLGQVIQSQTAASLSTYVNNLTNLQDGTKYYYRINPLDLEGNEYTGTVLTFDTLARPQIQDLQVTEVKGESQPTVSVKWNSNVESTSVISYYPEANPELVKELADAEYFDEPREKLLRGLSPNTRYIIILKVRDRFGNEAQSIPYNYVTGADSRPPNISNLRIETSVVNPGIGGEELPTSQLIVSWDTDEPATSQVEYGEGSNGLFTQKSFKETKLTLNHVVVITKLEPSKVYSLRVVSADVAGNQTTSGENVTITPKAGETAVEIVLRSLFDIFGFL